MLDQQFALLDVGGKLNNGENTVVLSGIFRNDEKILRKYLASLDHEEERNTLTFDSELEAIYLVGDFAVVPKDEDYFPGVKGTMVAKSFTIAEESGISPDNITTSGYPFYRGAVLMKYQLDLQKEGKVFLNMDKPFAHMVGVVVNGEEVATRMWEPFRVEITSAVRSGINEIELVLYSSNRNFLGHHHHPDRDLELLAPELFDQKCGYTDEYAFVRFGMNSTPWVEIEEDAQ